MSQFIVFRRTDIPNGVMVIKDLQPNVMTRDAAYDPIAQGPYYVRQLVNQSVATVTASNVISSPLVTQGLAAYLISHVERAGLGTAAGAFTAAQANTAALAIIAAARTGVVLNLAAINALLAAVVALTELDDAGGSTSTGTVADVMAILAGRVFQLPAGYVVWADDTDPTSWVGMDAATTAASFVGAFRTLYPTDSFMMSFAQGDLSVFSSASFIYKGVTAAAVAVYNDDGSLYTV
jgi:hypothetical protein